MNPLARPLLRLPSSTWVARLVAASCAATLGGGCLWWPDIQERPEVFFPPVIDRTRVTQPSPDQVVELVSTSTPFSVEGAVTDADTPPEDLVYAWYLDYAGTATPQPPAYSGYKPSIRLNMCFFSEELAPLGSEHLLELFVSDGAIDFDPETGRKFQGGYAYVSWIVKQVAACP